MTGDHRDRRRHASVGHGDAGGSGRSESRADARNNFTADPRLRERLGLLAATPEYVWVTTLKPHDACVEVAKFNQKRAYRFLRNGLARPFAYVDTPNAERNQRKNSSINKSVVYDDVGLSEQPGRAEGEQIRVAWPRANEIHGHGRTA